MAQTRDRLVVLAGAAALVAACGPGEPRPPEGARATNAAVVSDATAATTAATANDVATSGARDEGVPETAAKRPLLIVFTGDFCPPCRIMKPWIDEIAREEPGIAVARVNVDRGESERFVTFFQVESVPTLVFASATGDVLARRTGLMKKAELAKALGDLGWRAPGR